MRPNKSTAYVCSSVSKYVCYDRYTIGSLSAYRSWEHLFSYKLCNDSDQILTLSLKKACWGLTLFQGHLKRLCFCSPGLRIQTNKWSTGIPGSQFINYFSSSRQPRRQFVIGKTIKRMLRSDKKPIEFRLRKDFVLIH